MSFWSSPSVIGWSGFLRSWLWVVVKPLTSSPAIPMTTWVGRKPAISSASWRATAQLSTTAAMSATVPDCMCDRPWRLRPTPRTVPSPSSIDIEDERLGELRPDVERRAGGQRLAFVALPDPAPERHQAPVSRCRADGGQGVGQPLAPGPAALGHHRPTAAPAFDRRHRDVDQLAGGDPAADEIVGHRHEQLGLVGIERQGDDAGTKDPAQVAGDALERLHRIGREGSRHEPDARRDLDGGRGKLARLRDADAGTGLESTLCLAQLVLERRDPVPDRIDRLRAERRCGSRQAPRTGRVRARPRRPR